ncbi:MAG: hypothetical protein CCU26_03240 [Nitrospira sp. UW-LDO-01]|nr:hypothetical protein [Nitrospira sp.]OYT21090.1 MAG: hypothetical protein CCU26_03240 [Nitrospira sp. UW-LDO-01]
MGRRRQHHGGLALASDQIPGLAQHNIYPGLITFCAELAQAFHKLTSESYPRCNGKGKFEGTLRRPVGSH